MTLRTGDSSSRRLESPGPVYLLVGARVARSVGQGALAANFILELKRLHWSGPAIGAVLSGGILFSIAATLLFGPASDKYGRKPFLLGYELLQFLCALGGFLTEAGTPSALVLSLLAIVGGFGQATGGGAGAFSPVEQSWLSRFLPDSLRGHYFSLNTATGFFGMALGTLSGLYPHLLPFLNSPDAHARAVFLTVMAGALISLFLLLFVPDPHDEATSAPLEETLKKEWSLLRTLVGVNALNGFSLGLYAPLMAYWFSLRYGKGPGAIGLAMGGGYLLAGLFSLASAPLTRRIGTVRTVIVGRGAGLIFTLLIPLMPTFLLAVLVHLLRVASNQGTIGARQALSVGLVGEARRGLAASLHNVSMQIPQSVGPAVGAAFLSHGLLGTPFYLGALLQGGYLYLYYRAFEGFDTHKSRE